MKNQSFQPADPSSRAWAYIIDTILLVMPIAIIFPKEYNENSEIIMPNFNKMMVVLFLLYLLYFSLSLLLNEGQSIGQMCIKIKIVPKTILEMDKVKKTGKNQKIHQKNKDNSMVKSQKLNLQQAFLHSLGKFIYIIPFDLFLGWILLSKKKINPKPVRLLEYYAGTMCINEEGKKNKK